MSHFLRFYFLRKWAFTIWLPNTNRQFSSLQHDTLCGKCLTNAWHIFYLLFRNSFFKVIDFLETELIFTTYDRRAKDGKAILSPYRSFFPFILFQRTLRVYFLFSFTYYLFSKANYNVTCNYFLIQALPFDFLLASPPLGISSNSSIEWSILRIEAILTIEPSSVLTSLSAPKNCQSPS